MKQLPSQAAAPLRVYILYSIFEHVFNRKNCFKEIMIMTEKIIDLELCHLLGLLP